MDLSPIETLPLLTREEAAWLVGMTPEALDRVMTACGREAGENIGLLDLLRSGYALVGRKEAQAVMLGTQLTRALEREKELAEALRSRVFDQPLRPPEASPALAEDSGAEEEDAADADADEAPARKKKKHKRRKKWLD
ncbi:MAG: hypothetical protein HQL82_02220 [Magnetococcales bacterium]|nr:hypothetical protein [Magnetococcales bacterium]